MNLASGIMKEVFEFADTRLTQDQYSRKTLDMRERIRGYSVFFLIFLRYMKDFCTINWKHILSLPYLNISVDLENC